MQAHGLHFKRVVFWEPSVSPHKAPLFRAITRARPGIELVNVAQVAMAPGRSAMGWESPPPQGYAEVIGPSAAQCAAIAGERPGDTFHVFSGMRHVPCIVHGLQAVQAIGARFAIMSEPRVNEGIKGWGRYLLSWTSEGNLRRSATCVFAIGRNGPSWFRSVGYPAAKVFPFAYFIDPLQPVEVAPRAPDVGIRIGYLGRLVRAKGVFDLVSAFGSFAKGEARLELAGPFGGEETALRAAIGACAGEVALHGSLPMAQVASFLTFIDVLVLPSITKDDGWGVVVTEALMAGVPVVATYCVGASLVLDNPRLGTVVAPHAPDQLVAAIRRVAQADNLTRAERQWRIDWAQAHLSADAGAAYFWSVIDNRTGVAACPQPFYQQL